MLMVMMMMVMMMMTSASQDMPLVTLIVSHLLYW